jgi:hypothetical protein
MSLYEFCNGQETIEDRVSARIWSNNTRTICIVGPLGHGKSNLINVMFNKEMVKSCVGLKPVTTDVEIVRGSYLWYHVCVYDTPWDFANELEGLDVCVVVISGETLLIPAYIAYLKSLMERIDYDKNKGRIIFVLNRMSENVSVELLQEQIGIEFGSHICVNFFNATTVNELTEKNIKKERADMMNILSEKLRDTPRITMNIEKVPQNSCTIL